MNKTRIVRFIILVLFFILAGTIYISSTLPWKKKEIKPGVEPIKSAKESGDSNELSESFIPTVIEKKNESSIQEEKDDIIYVHVCGSVVTPGVYELTNKARVLDAIIKAGGFKEDAAKDAINQAQLLFDGQRLYIPNQEDMAAGFNLVELNRNQDQDKESGNQVNINVATKEELMNLPGIGESKAESIISYREEHNGFQSIEDIQKISGIKEAVFQKVKDYIVVR